MTRKTTTYARKHAQRLHQRAREIVLAKISDDVRGLQLDAAIHAWTGEDAARMADRAGRLCYIAAGAAGKVGLDPNLPDLRIVRGLANALADLVADQDNLERYRPSITAGVAAIDRLLPLFRPIDLAESAIELERLLDTTGVWTRNIEAAMGVSA